MNNENVKLTVGEVSKKLNVSVRTIQYYDQIGLVSPSEFTEGGRRLYSASDCMVLDQIISLKEFGFSLKEIKEQLMTVNTVSEMDEYLSKQEKLIKEKIKHDQVRYQLLHKFRAEMNKVGKVDWEAFIEIINMLRNQDEYYWVVKYLDKDLYETIKKNYQENKDKNYIKKMTALCEEAILLTEKGIPPNSKQGYELAKKWWQEIMDFTKGDMNLINELTKLSKESVDEKQTEFFEKFRKAEDFIVEALNYYFEENNIKIEEVKND